MRYPWVFCLKEVTNGATQAEGHPNPDFRHRVPVPIPAVAEKWNNSLGPAQSLVVGSAAAGTRDPHNPQRLIRLRARMLTLPVMVAIIVSLVWRRLGAVAEVRGSWPAGPVVGPAAPGQ